MPRNREVLGAPLAGRLVRAVVASQPAWPEALYGSIDGGISSTNSARYEVVLASMWPPHQVNLLCLVLSPFLEIGPLSQRRAIRCDGRLSGVCDFRSSGRLAGSTQWEYNG